MKEIYSFIITQVELSGYPPLENIEYPSSFTDERNNFIGIFEEICYYKGLSIECSKNNDFNNCVNNENAFKGSTDKLYNYYNSLI